MKAERAAGSERRGALLLVHGIGEQQPYEALDAFASGLARAVRVGPGRLEHRLVWREGRAVTAVRIPLGRPVGRAGLRVLDVYEFYWAGMVEGRVRLRQVLGWVARTSLTPLLFWASRPDLFVEESENSGTRPALLRRVFALGKELLVAVVLLGGAGLILAPFVALASDPAALLRAGAGLWRAFEGARQPLPLGTVLVAGFVGTMLLRAAIAGRGGPRRQAVLSERGFLWWRRATGLLAVVVLGVAVGIEAVEGRPATHVLRSLSDCLGTAGVRGAVLAAVAAVLLRRPLLKYLGDVTLYTTADERSGFFRTREEILSAAAGRLRSLLEDPAYDAIYVAGHSLGSVIAYDAINRLVREVRSEGEGKLGREGFDRLRGLLTFGSPLDKVQYFFRIRVRAGQAIRAQLLSSIHGFRRRRSGRSYGDLAFAAYRVPEPSDFRWLNVWSPADPVSARLDFFRVDEEVRRPYWRRPLAAHLAYWKDPVFFERVVAWL